MKMSIFAQGDVWLRYNPPSFDLPPEGVATDTEQGNTARFPQC
jgi:hypothetical protein